MQSCGASPLECAPCARAKDDILGDERPVEVAREGRDLAGEVARKRDFPIVALRTGQGVCAARV